MLNVSDINDTPHSSSESGRIPQAQLTFLDDVPPAGWIKTVGLMVPSTDPKVVGRWKEDRVDFCRDQPGAQFGLNEVAMVRVFRPPPVSSSRVTVDGLEWCQTKWSGIPTASANIDSLVLRTNKISLYLMPTTKTQPYRNGSGTWFRFKVQDINRVKQLVLHVHDIVVTWDIRISFLPEEDGSTTALVLTRKAA